jgi:hypothetical protein
MMRCFIRGLIVRFELRAKTDVRKGGKQGAPGGAWDSLMSDCRCVYEQNGTKVMLDNAGRFGRSGVGYAVLEDE